MASDATTCGGEGILQVLPVRQVQKGSRDQISAFKTALHQGLDAVALLVLPAEETAEDDDEHHLDQVRDDHGPDSERVRWSSLDVSDGVAGDNCRAGEHPRLIGFIEEWAGDVARTVAEEENCVGDDFLGVACVALVSGLWCLEMFVERKDSPEVFAICILRTRTNAALYGPVR